MREKSTFLEKKKKVKKKIHLIIDLSDLTSCCMRQERTAGRPFEGRQTGRDGLFLTGNRIIRANTPADEAREEEGGKDVAFENPRGRARATRKNSADKRIR